MRRNTGWHKLENTLYPKHPLQRLALIASLSEDPCDRYGYCRSGGGPDTAAIYQVNMVTIEYMILGVELSTYDVVSSCFINGKFGFLFADSWHFIVFIIRTKALRIIRLHFVFFCYYSRKSVLLALHPISKSLPSNLVTLRVFSIPSLSP